MIVLEPAAETLVKKLLEFRDAAEDAAETLGSLREAIEDHEKELDQDWTDMTEAVESLLGVVSGHAPTLDQRGDEAGGSVEGLSSLIAQVQESLAPSLEENEENLVSLRDQAAGADVETERLVSSAAETPVEGVSAQFDNIAEGVEKTAEDTVESIREGYVKEAEEAVSLAEQLVEASVKILTDNGTWVKQVVVAWTSKMAEVEDEVALQGFRKASKQAPQVVAYAIESLDAAQQEALAEVERLVGEARGELANLEEALREASADLGAASDSLEEQASGLVSAIGAAGEALQRVTEVLESRGAM